MHLHVCTLYISGIAWDKLGRHQTLPGLNTELGDMYTVYYTPLPAALQRLGYWNFFHITYSRVVVSQLARMPLLVLELAGRGSNKNLITLLWRNITHQLRGVAPVSAALVLIHRDMSRYQCNKIYIYVFIHVMFRHL